MRKRPFQIGILGCGTIGSEVANQLLSNKFPSLELNKILVKDLKKKRFSIDSRYFTDKADDLLNNPDIDLIIEVLGNEQPAKDYVLQALKNKKHIVSANKELFAKHGIEIYETAKKNNCKVQIEAAVAGGIPVIGTLRNDLQANDIYDVVGILNGTTNYILTEMKNGKEFEEALAEAQEKGYAEPDPTNDLEGYDAKYKIAILASLAFHSYVSPDLVECEGIKNISQKDFQVTAELGFSIKLLGRATKLQNNQITIGVSPYLIPQHRQISKIDGVLNGVFIRGDLAGEILLTGAGAGSKPTTSSILGDVLSIQKNYLSETVLPFNMKNKLKVRKVDHEFYVRLEVNDQIGVIRDISQVLAEHKISMASIVQHNHEDSADLCLLTHLIDEEEFQKAMKEIEKLSSVKSICSVMKVFS